MGCDTGSFREGFGTASCPFRPFSVRPDSTAACDPIMDT